MAEVEGAGKYFNFVLFLLLIANHNTVSPRLARDEEGDLSG